MPAVRALLYWSGKWLPGFLVLGLASLLPAAQAEDTLAGQRFQFIAAEQALERGDREAYQALLPRLQDYPLYPYLIYDDLRGRLQHNPVDEIRAFLDAYGDTYLADRLESKWLATLHRKELWRAYLEHYRDDGSLERDCSRRQALLKLGRTDEAMQDMETLWLHGFSLPESCDPALEAWHERGAITAELAWQRIDLAMDEGNAKLARYLGRYLPEDQRPLLERWYELYRHPERLVDADLSDAGRRQHAIAFNVAERLARVEPDRAASAWPRLMERFQFEPSQRHRIARRIALSYAYDGKPAALTWFEKIPAEDSDRYVRYWRVRAALAQQDWPAVLHWIEQLTPIEQGEERWQYWRARALEATGKLAQANELYARVANSRSYEGFLAADRIQAPYALDNKPLRFSAEETRQFASRPAMQRTRELLKLDRMLDARREWYAAMQELDDRQLQLAATLAHEWGWHDRAILTVSRAEYWDDLELRFPMPYLQTVRTTSQAAGVDEAWTYAVIRRESAFNSDARSHRGAVGLMQLLPSTARDVARTINRRLSRVAELYQADVNIQFGTAYLRMILEKFGEHPVLATAAYNAGPYRVQTWLPEQESVPADVWIETVPYTETREYLRNVLAYTAIYEQRMGRDRTPLQSRMPVVRPKAEQNRRAEASR